MARQRFRAIDCSDNGQIDGNCNCRGTNLLGDGVNYGANLCGSFTEN